MTSADSVMMMIAVNAQRSESESDYLSEQYSRYLEKATKLSLGNLRDDAKDLHKMGLYELIEYVNMG